MIELVFIVNGVDVKIRTSALASIETSRDKVLEMSNNTSRPVDEWEIHNDAGQQLDPRSRVYELGLKDGDRVFLNLKVGAGG